MARSQLKEDKRHGTPLFHFRSYTLSWGSGNNALAAHWHDEVEIIWVEKGPMVFTVDGRKAEVKAGDLLFINPGQIHGVGGRGRLHALVFGWDLLQSGADQCQAGYIDPLQRNSLLLPSRPPDMESRRSAIRVVKAVLEADRIKLPGWELEVKSGLLSLLASLLARGALCRAGAGLEGGDSLKAGRVKKSLEHIREHFRDDLGVESLAQAAGLSASHFSHVFKDMLGASPLAYLNQYRVQRAAELLAGGDRKILEVALDCGFGHLSYFIRTFKRQTGATPSAWRKKERGRG
jgi:AraC-like DNA-binding protein